MTRIVDHVEIDRVVLHGVDVAALRAEPLHALVEAEVAARLANAPLPAGRTVRAGLQLTSATLAAVAGGPRQIARVVADGVAGAVSGTGGTRA